MNETIAEWQMRGWTEENAYFISRLRKLDRLRIDIDSIPSDEADRKRDWEGATALFVIQFLDGGHSFGRLDAECFHTFEETPLNAIKEFLAYIIWRSECHRGLAQLWASESVKKTCYLAACEQVHQWLSTAQKLSLTEFAMINSWLEQRYLPAGRVDCTLPATAALVDEKARQLRNAGYSGDAQACATDYVQKFYGNIVAAIQTPTPETVKAILDGFRFGAEFEHQSVLVNCFEMALVTCFLDTEAIRSYEAEAGGPAV